MFVVLESKKLKPCAGFAAGKPRGCSEHVEIHFFVVVIEDISWV